MNVYILLDRSGSMAGMWEEALGSINAYVKALDAKTNIFMAVFDNDYKVIRNTTVAKWKDITNEDAMPRGNTRLFDSAARIMYRAFDDNAKKTVVVVMTDGEENASLNFKQSDVKQLAKHMDDKKWELIFLGANFDKVGDVATQNFGVAANKFTNITRGNMHEYMGTTLAAATTSYNTINASIDITEDDKRKATM